MPDAHPLSAMLACDEGTHEVLIQENAMQQNVADCKQRITFRVIQKRESAPQEGYIGLERPENMLAITCTGK